MVIGRWHWGHASANYILPIVPLSKYNDTLMVALAKEYRNTHTLSRPAQHSGHRFYSAEISRWLNRDPIDELIEFTFLQPIWLQLPEVAQRWSRYIAEESASENLYRFVENRPIGGADYLGQFTYLNVPPVEVSEYCCGTPLVVYDPKVKCCCLNGVVYLTNLSPLCSLRDRKPIPTGIWLHVGTVSFQIPDAPKQKHMAMDWSGYGNDGSADANAANSGKVAFPAGLIIDDDPPVPVKLDPCEYNFTKFHQCLVSEAKKLKGKNCANCFGFPGTLLGKCLNKKDTKGCTP